MLHTSPHKTASHRHSIGQVQHGFTLVELLVAMVISLILLGGMYQVYLSNKTTYNFSQALARVQEGGRFAMDYLSTEIRMADYWGCAAPGDVANRLDSGEPGYIDFTAGGVLGSDGADNDPSTGIGSDPDQITIRGISGNQFSIQEPYMPNVAAALQVSKSSNLEKGDIVMLSDCLAGDIFQITNVSAGQGSNANDKITITHNQGNVGGIEPGNNSNNLSKTYKGDASIARASAKTFYIASNPIGEPALFVSANGAVDELVEGVENMQILYGEDTSGDAIPDRYRPASSVGNMDNVITVRISLLIRSFRDNVVETPQTYTFNGQTITATDRRLRQVFTSTVTLRNRAN